jgi:capsid portal protein
MTDRALKAEVDTERKADAGAGVAVHVFKHGGGGQSRTVKKFGPNIPEGIAEEAEGETVWSGTEIVEPLYDPIKLLFLYNVSDTLRQCVDSMATNIDSHGHMFEPALDFAAEDIREQVAAALMSDGAQEPDEETIDKTIKEWKRAARIERIQLKSYFESVCFEYSFIDLRRATTTDKESVGSGSWEILRDEENIPVRFKHVPAHSLRLTKTRETVTVEETVPAGVLKSRKVEVDRKLRLIVQLDETGSGYTYFKTFGDPRRIGTDGEDYTPKEGEAEKELPEGVKLATEILLFKTYFPGTPYGVVRWHGMIPQIQGSREAQETTLDYLENSAIPRGMLLVADGRMGSDSVTKLENFFRTLKGEAENRMVVVEAETPRDKALEQSGRVQIQWVSFHNDQRDDATFAGYIGANAHAVGSSFRLPPIIRGDTKDFNRATAVAALEYAEEQVFAPEREAFDWIINRKILPLLDVRFWKFVSRAPRKSDPEAMAKIAESFLKHGVVVPSEMRALAERVLGVDLPNDAADFQRLPLQAWLAGFQPPPVRSTDPDGPITPPTSAPPDMGQTGAPPGDNPADGEDEEALARKILTLKARLERVRAAKHAARTMDSISDD